MKIVKYSFFKYNKLKSIKFNNKPTISEYNMHNHFFFFDYSYQVPNSISFKSVFSARSLLSNDSLFAVCLCANVLIVFPATVVVVDFN